jgi:hypothetical protein
VNLLCFQDEDKGVIEVHPEHRFCYMVSESVLFSTERVTLWCFHHEIGSGFEVHPEHRFCYMVSESVLFSTERVTLGHVSESLS